jgi:hypothetical protein
MGLGDDPTAQTFNQMLYSDDAYTGESATGTPKEQIYGDDAYTGASAGPTVKQQLYSDTAYTGFTPDQSKAWYDVIGKFTDLSNKFDAAYADLQARGNAVAASGNAQLQTDYSAIIAKCQGIYRTVDAVRSAIVDVKAVLSGAIDSATGAWDNVKEWVSGLGIVPLIPIAVALAAIAAITAFLVEYAKFTKNMDTYTSLVQQGHPPSEAASIVAKMQTGGILSTSVGGIPMWLLLVGGVAAFYFINQQRRLT